MSEEVEVTSGAFGESLKRNNKQIRNDRAQTIVDVINGYDASVVPTVKNDTTTAVQEKEEVIL